MPEAVDTELFDASKHTPLEIMSADKRFKFLSIFKWEARKGWVYLVSSLVQIYVNVQVEARKEWV
jgi:hypothetical protein